MPIGRTSPHSTSCKRADWLRFRVINRCVYPPPMGARKASVYPLGSSWGMGSEHLLAQAREAAGLSQAALAAAAGRPRPTLSAYEQWRKSPTLDTAPRIVGEAGFELALAPKVSFVEVAVDRGRPIVVPTALPRLLCRQCPRNC